MIEQIDKAIENQDVTFSHFVIRACIYALENMDASLGNSNEDNE